VSYNPKSLAFPRVVSEPTSECDDGMDLRTYLAGQAMAGLLANSKLMEAMGLASKSDQAVFAAGNSAMVVRHADALIAELNKEKP